MILDPVLDIFRGKAVTIPPLDGAFRPNNHLDDAHVIARLSEVDDLAVHGQGIVASSGNAVYQIEANREPKVIATYSAPISALAVTPDGEVVVGLETGKLLIGDQEQNVPKEIGCITALAFSPDGTLWLANGSADVRPAEWSADLMRHGSSGSIWKREAGSTTFQKFAGGLAYPYGLLPVGTGDIIVSESWRHRLQRFDGNSGRSATVADKLPGYPARLSPTADGGAWLSLFAPRNRLIEFVLQENHYRTEMMAQVPREYWIAPAMSSGRSFLEPLQCGGIKTMGIHKPWSPSRSYGMAVRLNASMQPELSMHSRANGSRHGTCSAVEHGNHLFVASKGGDCLLDVDLSGDNAAGDAK